MSSRNKPTLKEVPAVLNFGTVEGLATYKRGNFLGKGGFARCYEFVLQSTKPEKPDTLLAGKIISKKIIVKQTQRDKMMQEIRIHSKLKHPNVVRLEDDFEDAENFYIFMEICPNHSLMELQKRRRTVTEPEARFFIHEIVNGCQYLHDLKIVHRDLKLGNLFLSENLNVKIGDFGLATEMEREGQKRTTLCGTPNYIAPEMLLKLGHDYAVDIWAIGCILYTLLVGKPPFETDSLKQTYSKIRHNEYTIPARIGQHAHNLISALLTPNPENRPTIHEIPHYSFFTDGFLPASLPHTCLTSAPRFNIDNVSGGMVKENTRLGEAAKKSITVPGLQDEASVVVTSVKANKNADVPLVEQLAKLAKYMAPFNTMAEHDRVLGVLDEEPASSPMFWISKWVDYSNRYGLSYQLNDGSVGVNFNDNTRIMVDPSGYRVQYREDDGSEKFFKMSDPPAELVKKVKLLDYFIDYMNHHLVSTEIGKRGVSRGGRNYARFSYLDAWFRTNSAIVLLMTDGTLQLNFFQDHSKLILDPGMAAVTYLGANRDSHTYSLKYLAENGCSKDLLRRLKYAYTMVARTCDRFGIRI